MARWSSKSLQESRLKCGCSALCVNTGWWKVTKRKKKHITKLSICTNFLYEQFMWNITQYYLEPERYFKKLLVNLLPRRPFPLFFTRLFLANWEHKKYQMHIIVTRQKWYNEKQSKNSPTLKFLKIQLFFYFCFSFSCLSTLCVSVCMWACVHLSYLMDIWKH